jgi:serine/threonine-protein kinase ULK/ATG1
LKFPEKPMRSQKVKLLVSQMLKIAENERLSWDEVFENNTIQLHESKIKHNFHTILREKGI